MFYRKNVPAIERIVRLAGGAALLAYGLIGLHGAPFGWLATASGVGALVTGFVGYCPACAMIGRKPTQR